MSGIKHDSGKLRFDLIPPEGIEGAALVYTIGASKYADRNWEKGMRWGRLFGAMMRHAWAWWRGQEYDEDGFHHLDAVIFCAMGLRTYVARNVGEDDRVKVAYTTGAPLSPETRLEGDAP